MKAVTSVYSRSSLFQFVGEQIGSLLTQDSDSRFKNYIVIMQAQRNLQMRQPQMMLLYLRLHTYSIHYINKTEM